MLTLVVLAAGLGTRYGGLKQLDSVGPNGETLIDYSVYDAIEAGFGKLVFVIRDYFEDDFRKKVMHSFETRVECHCVDRGLEVGLGGRAFPEERIKPWGTGHAVLAAESRVEDPFAVVNADDYYGANSMKTMADFLSVPHRNEYAMVGYVLRNTLSEHGFVSRGICSCDESRNLVDIVERLKIYKEGRGAYLTDEHGERINLTGDEVASMNLWGFTPEFFTHLGEEFHEFLDTNPGNANTEFLLPAAVNQLIETGQSAVKVLSTDDSWFGITYREDRQIVEKRIRELIARGVYPEKLW